MHWTSSFIRTNCLAALLGLSVCGLPYAQTCRSDVTSTSPTTRFVLSGSEASDTLTGLVWLRCSLGQTWNATTSTCDGAASTYTWPEALLAASDLSGGYRVPNILEIQSIFEARCNYPPTNRTVFPNMPYGLFWSSTPSLIDANVACHASLNNGNTYCSISNGSTGQGQKTTIKMQALVVRTQK